MGNPRFSSLAAAAQDRPGLSQDGRFMGQGFRVQGLGFRVLGFRVLGFRVLGRFDPRCKAQVRQLLNQPFT